MSHLPNSEDELPSKNICILCYISPSVFASINVQRHFLFHIPNTWRLLGYCSTHISSTSTNLTCIVTVVSLNQRKMTTVKIHQMGGLIQHKTQGKGIFFKITEWKEVFSSESLTNNSTNTSKKSAITRSGLNYLHTRKPDKKSGLMWTQTNMWMLPKLFMDITLMLLKIRFWLQPTQFQNTRLIC